MAARGAGSMQVIVVPRPPSATARARKRVEWPEPISTIRRGLWARRMRVGGGGVEAREPVLVEARRTVAGRDRVKLARRRADVVEHRPEPGLRRLKQRAQGRVVPSASTRAGIAVGDEEAAPREPEDRREAEAEPARPPSHDQRGGPGVPGGGGLVAGPIRSRQECARRARSNSSTTTSAIMKGMRR